MSQTENTVVTPDVEQSTDSPIALTGYSLGYELAKSYHETGKMDASISDNITKSIKDLLATRSDQFQLGEAFGLDVPPEFRQLVTGAYRYASEQGLKKSDKCVTRVKQRVLMGYRNAIKVYDDWKVSLSWVDKEGIIFGFSTISPDIEEPLIISDELKSLAEKAVNEALKGTNDTSRAKKAAAKALANEWASRSN